MTESNSRQIRPDFIPLISFVRILSRIFCETELIKLKCPQCPSVHQCYQFKFSRFLSAQIDNWQFQRFSAMTWNALGIEIISAVFCVNMFLKWTKNSLIMWGIEAQKWPRKVQSEHNTSHQASLLARIVLNEFIFKNTNLLFVPEAWTITTLKETNS